MLINCYRFTELLDEIPAPQSFISDLLATVVTKPS